MNDQNSITQPTRPGAIDKTSGTASGFPDHAFEHDGVESNATPILTLISPWSFDIETGFPNTVPIGAIMPWATGLAPAGYVLCDGTSYLRTTYSDLFDVIQDDYGAADGTHFNVPDYRGVFLRGAGDHGSMTKVDTTAYGGGAVADENDDMLFGHWHELRYGAGAGGSAYNWDGPDANNLAPHDNAYTESALDYAYDATTVIADGVNGTPNTGNETAPANVAVSWIIRATDTAVVVEKLTSATVADLIVTNNADIQGSLEVGGDIGTDGDIEADGSISNIKGMMTPEGGFAISLTNKTGGVSAKGYLVEASGVTDNACSLTTDGDIDPIGVIYNAGITDGSEVWVVVSGIADVYYGGNVTRATFSRVPVAGDGYNTGEAINEALPTPPFATDKHFQEIGHPIESRVGAGLAKTVLHFN